MRPKIFFMVFLGLWSMSQVSAQNKITFDDNGVKAICVDNWDTDDDGELSYEEAAAVNDLGSVFAFNDEITSFDELAFFVGLREISTYAFYKCYNLKRVSVPEGVTSLKRCAFFDCNALSDISLPTTLTTIEEYAFDACQSISKMNVPDGVTTIGEFAFSYCSGLLEFSIPSTVTNMAKNALSNCYYLERIQVDPANTVYDSRDDCNAIIVTKTNTLAIGCKNTIIPSDVKEIGIGAFTGCQGLTNIYIPQGVTYIQERAFSSCGYLERVSIPTTVTTIGTGAFWGCSSLTGVVIPNGVTSIGSSAFKSCRKLTSVYLPSSLTEIGTDAFFDSPILSEVTVGFSTPLTITEATFPNRKKATLYVPKGSKRAFTQAIGWKDFNNIVERDMLDVFVNLQPEDIFVYVGNSGQLTVGLTNDALMKYKSFQMDVVLPEGIKADVQSVVLSSRCEGMTAKVTELGDNTYQLSCTSDNMPLTATEGSLFSIGVEVSADIDPGEYTGIIKKCIFTCEDGASVQTEDTQFLIHVSDYRMGDINHDGNVNVADVMLGINYVLGNNPSAFYSDKADVNGDEQINITDVMCIVKIIMGDGSM